MSSTSPRNCQPPIGQSPSDALPPSEGESNRSPNSPSSTPSDNPAGPNVSPGDRFWHLTVLRHLLPAVALTGVGLLGMTSTVRAIPRSPSAVAQRAPSTATDGMNVIYVSSSTGNDSGNGTQSSPLRTITQALRIAKPNTAIILAPGTYSAQTGEVFPLMLRPNVTVQGDPENRGENIVISGGGPFTSRTFATQSIAILGANAARLSGVTVTNPNGRGYGLWLESTSMIVSNNTFAGNVHDGISVVGMGTPLIQENRFAENGANGITVFGSSKPEIRNNEFQNTGFGINIAQRSAPFVVGNRIIYNRDGVVIQASARPVLRNNYIEQNRRDGIVAIAQSLPDLGTPGEPGQNVIRNNGRYDVNNGTEGLTLQAYGNELATTQIAGLLDVAGSYQAPAEPSPIATGLLRRTSGEQNDPAAISPINESAALPVYLPESDVPPEAIRDSAPIATQPPPPAEPEATRDSAPIPIPVPPPETPRATAPASPPPAESASRSSTGSLLLSLLSRAISNRPPSEATPNSRPAARPVPAPQNQSTITATPPAVSPSGSILPVPGGNIPIGSGGGQLPNSVATGLPASSSQPSLAPVTAALLGLRYRVVVQDTGNPTLRRVRSVVPEAFRTVVDGERVIQAGAFRDRYRADQLLRQLQQYGVNAQMQPFN